MCRSVDFAPAVIALNRLRQGVLGNPWLALDHAFGVSPDLHGPRDFAILAEEDLIVSPDVLEYFTWCQRYADDPICAGRDHLPAPRAARRPFRRRPGRLVTR